MGGSEVWGGIDEAKCGTKRRGSAMKFDFLPEKPKDMPTTLSWSWKCDPELWLMKLIKKLTGKKEDK